MFESLTKIQCRSLMPMSFISKSELNIMGKCPASYLKVSWADVMDLEDKEDIP